MTQRYLHLDIETYSDVDLLKHGVYPYAESDQFEILMCAYRAPGARKTRIAIGREQIDAIPGLRDPDVIKVAHNAQFERVCFSAHDGLPVGQYLDPRQWLDTAALAAQYGWPRALGKLAVAMGAQEKDEAGTRLINLFCKPQKGKRVTGDDKPEQWAEFVAYCIQDVDTLVDVHSRLGDFPNEFERELWAVDQSINDRGIKVDLELAHAAIAAEARNLAIAAAELESEYGVVNPGSIPQMTRALGEVGLHLPNLRAETISEVMSGPLEDHQRRILELRQQTSLVASKKYQAAVDACSPDERLRGQFRHHGAHTGRWSGRGVQLQNLPREQITRMKDGKKVWDSLGEQAAILDLKMGADLSPKELKSLVRPMFLGPFTVVDFSAIEARGLAWLAGEQWVLDAFIEGRDIYVETANRMSTPDRPLGRQQGKVAVLALGYNGGIHSLRNMGADGTDDELQDLVYRWRDANPKIRAFWKVVEKAFIYGGRAGRHIRVEKRGLDRWVWLPSGRPLVYHNVRLVEGDRGPRITFDDPKGFRADTYGGRLSENYTQAITRDILAEALVRLYQAGYDVVLHVHDEAGIEGAPDIALVSKIMCQLPEWATGFPIDAEGYITERYRKD